MNILDDFILPENICSALANNSRIIQTYYLFKNGKYQILYDKYGTKTYYVQVINLPIDNVELRRLNSYTNILVMGRNFIQEQPNLVVSQIINHIIGPPIISKDYPTGFYNEGLTISEHLDVGQGVYPWPSRVFSPYVDITAWPTYQIADMAQITGALYYILGFVVAQSATDCTPTWGTYYPIDNVPGLDQIKKLRELGGDITISFGGAANVPVHICAPDVSTIKQIYSQVIELYNLTRIDFDIEGVWTEYDEANERNAQALKLIQDEYSDLEIWLTLPVLQSGLVPSGERIVGQMINAGVNLTGVNVMTMEYGPPIEDMGQAAIEAITSLNSQLGGDAWDMIGATPLIGKNNSPGEVFYQNNARDLMDFCITKDVRMLSMWSSNRDNSQGSGIPQQDNEFTTIFVPYTSDTERSQIRQNTLVEKYAKTIPSLKTIKGIRVHEIRKK